MTENQLPTPPASDGTATTYAAGPATPRRTWRDRLPTGRRTIAAGAVVAGLAIGGAGFGAGYAVGDDGAADTATTRTTGDWGDRGMPGDRGPMGGMGGGPLGGTTQDQGGTAGEQPDFDGDGQPDTDTDGTDGTDGTDSGSTSDSATQNS